MALLCAAAPLIAQTNRANANRSDSLASAIQAPDQDKPKQDVPDEAGGRRIMWTYAIPKKKTDDAPPPPPVARKEPTIF